MLPLFFLEICVCERDSEPQSGENQLRSGEERETRFHSLSPMGSGYFSMYFMCEIMLMISVSMNEQGDRPTQILENLIQWKELYHPLGLEPYGSWLGQPFRL